MNQPLNTPAETMVAQARENLRRDLPMFVERGAHKAKLCIVGGGPSLHDMLPKLRYLIDSGAHVMALNGTHDWLIGRGINPGLHVMLDARAENAQFVRRPHKDVTYLIAAQCHPSVFDALKGHEVVMWIAYAPGMKELADETDKPVTLIGGGSTVGLKAMMLAFLWGFRSFHLFGFDSCYRKNHHHAYPQTLNDGEQIHEVTVDGKRFSCSRWMAVQAEDFANDASDLMRRGCRVKAYGAGLIQTILKHIQEPEHAAA